MINIIRQNIGIYYRTVDWKDTIYDLILAEIPEEIIEKRAKGGIDSFIYLKDGTSIRFIPCLENIRGVRFDKVFMEDGIDKNFLDCVIRPAHTGYFYRGENIIYLDKENGKISIEPVRNSYY